MKRSSLVLLVAALIAAASLTVMPTQQPAVADGHEKPKDIAESMEYLAGTYRTVRRQMGKADMNADTADKLSGMIYVSTVSKEYMPKTATTDDLKNSYRVVMNKLIIALAHAENAALTGEQADLRKYVLEANTVRGEGHELFIPDDE